MNPMQSFAAKQVMNNAVGKMKNTMSSQEQQQINWDDFNYPVCLKVIHYQPEELGEQVKRTVLLQNRVMKIVLVICILNILNNTIQVLYQPSCLYRLLQSALTFIILMPIQLALFYRLLLGVAKDKQYLNLFIYLQIVMLVLYFLFSILAAGSFNGFYRAYVCFNRAPKMPVAAIICIVESIFYWFAILISFVVLVKARNIKNNESLVENQEQMSTNN